MTVLAGVCNRKTRNVKMVKYVWYQCMLLFIQISTYTQEQSYTIGSYHLLLAQKNTWQTVNVGGFCMGFGNILMYNYTLQYVSWLKTINFSVKMSNFYFIFDMLSLIMIQFGLHMYIVCLKSNASDFFAQPRTARKGKWELRQVEGEPTYTVGPSSVESAPL